MKASNIRLLSEDQFICKHSNNPTDQLHRRTHPSMASATAATLSLSALSSASAIQAAPASSFSSFASTASCSFGFSKRRFQSLITSVSTQNSSVSAPTSTPECEDGDIECEILSGEWPENFSMLNYEDLCKHYEPILLKEEAQPSTFLADVMSEIKFSATPDQLLEEVDHCFLTVSGLPVINNDLKCIGVLSKKDRAKASKGLQSTVGEVMSSPPFTLSADKTVNDAAVLMLKHKIHRIPIVNEANQLVGMITRTDIFTALEHQA